MKPIERNTIEPKQFKIIYAIAKNQGLDNRQLHQKLKYKFGKNHLRELTRQEGFLFANYLMHSKEMSSAQFNKIINVHKAIIKTGANYSLEGLAERIVGEKNIDKLTSTQASKLIQALQGIIKNLGKRNG
jgi:hypothetical protein